MVMNDAVIIQQTYPNGGYENLIQYTLPTTLSYCNKHKVDYQFTNSVVNDEWQMGQGGWAKLLLIQKALEKYQYVVWMDADTIIVNESEDIRCAVKQGIGATFHQKPEPHFNVGMLYMVNSDDVRWMIRNWIYKYPGYDNWYEQRIFNDMISFYPNIVYKIEPKWNSWFGHEESENPVVASYHDCGPWQRRIKLMYLIKEKYVYLDIAKKMGSESSSS
jgi:hypothetical protein